MFGLWQGYNQLGLLMIGGNMSGAVNGNKDRSIVHNSEEVMSCHTTTVTLGMIPEHY